jgi:hypothetical protein
MTLRPFFAWAMLAYAGAELFFIALNWLIADDGLLQRSQRADTTTLTTIGLPILAVLLSAWVKPPLGIAKTVAMVALAEYAMVLVFGGLTFTLGLMNIFDVARGINGALALLSYVVFGLLGFAFALMCAFVAWRHYSGKAVIAAAP